jgi:probable HAF family extracellular repeat protein
VHAFLYSNGVTTSLGTLGGDVNWANGVNNAGQVVGAALTASNAAQHAFLYSNGVMTDLNSLIDPASDWTLEEADAINDNGQIVCCGYQVGSGQQHAILLTPVSVLKVSALASAGWVYQNSPVTTNDGHVVALTVSVTQDTWGNNTYITMVWQTGLGVVTPTAAWTSGTTVTPALSSSWAGLSGYLVGGRVNGQVTGATNLSQTGICVVHVLVTGNVGGSAYAEATILVRPLGDINGDGQVDQNDLAVLTNRLNGFAIAPQTDADCDLSGDGAVTTADRVLLNLILNGVTVP